MENKKFEDLLNELNDVVKKLESGELSLEDSITMYKRGMELSSACKKLLEEAKETVLKEVNK